MIDSDAGRTGPEGAGTSRIDPEQLGPVREFLRNPIGHHSPELDAILSHLRGGPVAGKYCLICTRPHQEWVIGRLAGQRNAPPIIEDNRAFRSIEDAERAIFRLRWLAQTGVALDESMT